MNSSLIVEVGLETRLYQQGAVLGTPAATERRSKLDVFVIFTDYSGTLAMLQRAHQLTKKLEAYLHLLPPYEVPYALPLTIPPVSVESLEEQTHALASKIRRISLPIFICAATDAGLRA